MTLTGVLLFGAGAVSAWLAQRILKEYYADDTPDLVDRFRALWAMKNDTRRVEK